MCSTVIFGTTTNRYLAENYDYPLDHGLVGVNLRETTKENGRQPGETAIRWSVKYGSVTFNSFSLELPVSGMNEAGLAVALMWHDEGDFGNEPGFSRLSPLQWIQYQLDNYKNIEEVLEGLKTVRARNEGIPLHYSLLDAKGNCLLIEFVDGEIRLEKNPEFPILTNSTYQLCLTEAKRSFGSLEMPKNSSIARFCHLYDQYAVQNHAEVKPVDGFNFLDSVSQTPGAMQSFPWNKGNENNTITVWSIVFCPREREILFKTNQKKTIKKVKLGDIGFEKNSQYLAMEINEEVLGPVTQSLKPYSKDSNRYIVQQSSLLIPLSKSEQDNLVETIDSLYDKRDMRVE